MLQFSGEKEKGWFARSDPPFDLSSSYLKYAKWLDLKKYKVICPLINFQIPWGQLVGSHYMTQEEFNQWLQFAQKTAWKNFANDVEGGQELLDLALDAMKE